ncbi:UNVERIFIED_CONTAM: hypothetical protein K2H54_055593 [Gekko kuhli]
MLRFLRRTFGRRSMQRYGRGGGGGGGAGDERDGGALPRGPGAASPPPHIQAVAAGSKAALQCRVQLLDGAEVSVELPWSLAAGAAGGCICMKPQLGRFD